ncbi:MAG: hypothetical protein BRD44_03140 [Bacteroidetes bacterium QS_7_67_15]|nr:MAG: hypothetical protein BRD44_03140 [Bacteroidetes bacterium QS_7_67_15]
MSVEQALTWAEQYDFDIRYVGHKFVNAIDSVEHTTMHAPKPDESAKRIRHALAETYLNSLTVGREGDEAYFKKMIDRAVEEGDSSSAKAHRRNWRRIKERTDRARRTAPADLVDKVDVDQLILIGPKSNLDPLQTAIEAKTGTQGSVVRNQSMGSASPNSNGASGFRRPRPEFPQSNVEMAETQAGKDPRRWWPESGRAIVAPSAGQDRYARTISTLLSGPSGDASERAAARAEELLEKHERRGRREYRDDD